MFQVHVTVIQTATATVLQELTLTLQVQHVRPVHRALSKWMGWILSSSGLVWIDKILRNIVAFCPDINIIDWSFDWVVDWALKTNFLLGICSQKRAVQMCVCMSLCVIKIKIVPSIFEHLLSQFHSLSASPSLWSCIMSTFVLPLVWPLFYIYWLVWPLTLFYTPAQTPSLGFWFFVKCLECLFLSVFVSSCGTDRNQMEKRRKQSVTVSECDSSCQITASFWFITIPEYKYI